MHRNACRFQAFLYLLLIAGKHTAFSLRRFSILPDNNFNWLVVTFHSINSSYQKTGRERNS
jgi:hypothetical protein